MWCLTLYRKSVPFSIPEELSFTQDILHYLINHIDPSINLARDVADILFMFDKLGALSWNEGGSPFMINEISHDENGLSVKWADESDIREIIRAYKTTFRSPGYVNFS